MWPSAFYFRLRRLRETTSVLYVFRFINWGKALVCYSRPRATVCREMAACVAQRQCYSSRPPDTDECDIAVLMSLPEDLFHLKLRVKSYATRRGNMFAC